MKILVTGSQGFFASRFIKEYSNKHQIYGLSKSEMDITSVDSVEKNLISIKPDIVLHAAAVSDTGQCEKFPHLSERVNVEGTQNLGKVCEKFNIKLIYISSDQVYKGVNDTGPYSEEQSEPCNVYGRHKLRGENLLLNMNLDVVILRITWLFSLPEKEFNIKSNILWNLITARIKGSKVNILERDYRSVTYVYDLIDNMEKIFSLPKGIYNAGSENSMSVLELQELITSWLGFSNGIEDICNIIPMKEYDHNRDLRIDTSKLREFGIMFPDSKEGILKCLKDFNFDLKI